MKWTLKHIEGLKSKGLIRDFKTTELKKTKFTPLDWLDENIGMWCRLQGLTLLKEHRVVEGRRWRFDYYMPEIKTAIEYEGGIYMRRGGHNTAAGIHRDIEKYEAAQNQGIKVIRLTVSTYKSVFERIKI